LIYQSGGYAASKERRTGEKPSPIKGQLLNHGDSMLVSSVYINVA